MPIFAIGDYLTGNYNRFDYASLPHFSEMVY